MRKDAQWTLLDSWPTENALICFVMTKERKSIPIVPRERFMKGPMTREFYLPKALLPLMGPKVPPEEALEKLYEIYDLDYNLAKERIEGGYVAVYKFKAYERTTLCKPK